MWSLTRDPGAGLTEAEHAKGRYPDIPNTPKGGTRTSGTALRVLARAHRGGP